MTSQSALFATKLKNKMMDERMAHIETADNEFVGNRSTNCTTI